jgi:hypothetical protein
VEASLGTAGGISRICEAAQTRAGRHHALGAGMTGARVADENGLFLDGVTMLAVRGAWINCMAVVQAAADRVAFDNLIACGKVRRQFQHRARTARWDRRRREGRKKTDTW